MDRPRSCNNMLVKVKNINKYDQLSTKQLALDVEKNKCNEIIINYYV